MRSTERAAVMEDVRKKCTGLRNTCSTKDVDMLAIIEEIVEHCWSSDIVNVCIIFDCIPGK